MSKLARVFFSILYLFRKTSLFNRAGFQTQASAGAGKICRDKASPEHLECVSLLLSVCCLVSTLTSQNVPGVPASSRRWTKPYGDLENRPQLLAVLVHHLENGRIWSWHKGYRGDKKRPSVLDLTQTAVSCSGRNPIRHFPLHHITTNSKGIPLSIKCMRIDNKYNVVQEVATTLIGKV